MDENKERRKKVIYEFISSDIYVPMKLKEIAIMFQVPKEERNDLKAVLEELETEGKVEVTAKKKYVKGKGNRLVGLFTAHERGFGFVTIEGREQDIFISRDDVNGALQGDKVEVVLSVKKQEGKREEGKIMNILSRGTSRLIGYYERSKNFGFVKPDSAKFAKDIFVPHERSKGAVTGHKVVVELTSYGGEGKKPEGKIVEILGHSNDPGVDILSIIKGYDLPMEFPEKVLNQAERISKPVSEQDCKNREDLRGVLMVTIDGEDAKDLDDAVSVSKEGNIYKLGVHIADVTNYVQENSAIDWEARERGTSVYLVDRVIPMLPHTLSNGICSLNAGEDRLALSCIMEIDEKGRMVAHQILESVIHVDKRMSYTDVSKILEDKDIETIEANEKFIEMFQQMEELANILREKRHKRGAIDFDFPETKMILDEAGKPIQIKPYDRNVATKIIEDFMLMANETVAEDYFWQEIPFVYRVHEIPDEEKIKKLGTFIQNFGYVMHLGQDKVHPKELQKLLSKIEGSGEYDLISRLALRSMKQAKYTPDNSGHFGLAAKYYSHFTSPIRRYPDLQIHRIIKENIRGKLTQQRLEHFDSILPEVTKSCSELERRAEEAERETIKLKKAEFMQQHIGECFEGVISSITKWGIYVELENTIEGLVHVTAMTDDHYNYDESKYEMVGERTGCRYKLGEKVAIEVTGVDKIQRTVDFKIAKKRKARSDERTTKIDSE